MKKYTLPLLGLFIGIGLVLSGSAYAQVTTTSATSTISTTDITALQNQIVQLTTLVQNLQAQIAARLSGMAGTGTCYTFSNANIGYGARNNDVTTLQNFLMAQGYLNIPVATGYFGTLTKTALQNYQAGHTISGATYGTLDAATMAKINANCGQMTTSNPINTTPITTTTATPQISSISNNTMAGGNVTLNGSNFGSGSATLYLTGPNGNITIPNIATTNNGTSLNFNLPMTNASSSICTTLTNSGFCSANLSPGTYTIYLKDANGNTSNYTTLTVNPYTLSTNIPVITSLSTTTGATGNVVTITGTGFLPTGNIVTFGGNAINGVSSTNNGTTIQFTIPASTSTNTILTSGNYNVGVTTPNGQSNTTSFTIK